MDVKDLIETTSVAVSSGSDSSAPVAMQANTLVRQHHTYNARDFQELVISMYKKNQKEHSYPQYGAGNPIVHINEFRKIDCPVKSGKIDLRAFPPLSNSVRSASRYEFPKTIYTDHCRPMNSLQNLYHLLLIDMLQLDHYLHGQLLAELNIL
jgi:hypothetical protein